LVATVGPEPEPLGSDVIAELLQQVRALDTESNAEISADTPTMKGESEQGLGMYRGRHHSEWLPEVDRLRAMAGDAEAEELLLGIVNALEEESAHDGHGVTPAAYELLALMYRKRRDAERETAILERFAAQRHAPGAAPSKLLRRLARLRAKSS
jgi:hypothetical protein